MFALDAESYKKLNEALRHEIENLKASERHTAAIHGGSSTRGTVSAAELQKERTRREEVEKGYLKLEKMYDDLTVKFVVSDTLCMYVHVRWFFEVCVCVCNVTVSFVRNAQLPRRK